MSASEVYVGIDVSKAQLGIAITPSDEAWENRNEPQGWNSLGKRLLALSPTLMVMEATGKLEAPVAAYLTGLGLPVVVATPPRQVRGFARAIGILTKTDRPDVKVLAQFANCWSRYSITLYSRPNMSDYVSTENKKVALTKAMRKFIIILNAMVRNQTHWKYEPI